MKKCRLCNSKNIKKILTIKNMPSNIWFLYNDPKEFINDKPIKFKLFQCTDCDFIQAEENKLNDYYEDYIMTVSHSNKMNTYQKKQAKDFIEKYNLKSKNIIEVGCWDWNFMQHLLDLWVNVNWIEPSNNFRKIAISKWLNVFQWYVSENNLIEWYPYDWFVTREVLEHIPNINDFLKWIYNSLKDNAVWLIEVPCMEKTFKDSRFYDFFPDHVNYFTEKTLNYALIKNWFTIIDFFYWMDQEYNNIVVQKQEKMNFDKITNTIDNLSLDINKFINFFVEKKLKIWIWWAGAKWLTVLAVSKAKNIEFIIDSDKYKVNKYTPISHIKIVSPDYINDVDAIIITAMAYKDEIIKNLNEQYGFKWTIAILWERLQIIENKHGF